MKTYGWIIALTFALLTFNSFASVGVCADIAMATASEVAAGQPTKATVDHIVEVDKNVADYVYSVEVVGGQGGEVQNVATTIRVYFKEGVAYCG